MCMCACVCVCVHVCVCEATVDVKTHVCKQQPCSPVCVRSRDAQSVCVYVGV